MWSRHLANSMSRPRNELLNILLSGPFRRSSFFKAWLIGQFSSKETLHRKVCLCHAAPRDAQSCERYLVTARYLSFCWKPPVSIPPERPHRDPLRGTSIPVLPVK